MAPQISGEFEIGVSGDHLEIDITMKDRGLLSNGGDGDQTIGETAPESFPGPPTTVIDHRCLLVILQTM